MRKLIVLVLMISVSALSAIGSLKEHVPKEPSGIYCDDLLKMKIETAQVEFTATVIPYTCISYAELPTVYIVNSNPRGDQSGFKNSPETITNPDIANYKYLNVQKYFNCKAA